MKLIQLQEARYAGGDHPVINKLKAALKDGLPFPRGAFRTTFWDLEIDDVSSVVKSLTDMFGDPRVGSAGTGDHKEAHHWDPQTYHWEPKFNDHRYGITIGHDGRHDPPYGLEVYYIEGPRGTDARYSRALPRQ